MSYSLLKDSETKCGATDQTSVGTMAWACPQNGPEPDSKDRPKTGTTWKTQTRSAQNNMAANHDGWAERVGSDMGRGPTRSPGPDGGRSSSSPSRDEEDKVSKCIRSEYRVVLLKGEKREGSENSLNTEQGNVLIVLYGNCWFNYEFRDFISKIMPVLNIC